MKFIRYFLFFSVFYLGHPLLAVAATYIVDQSGTGDFTTIQGAVNQAAAIESMGPTKGSAYFTHASDIVSIYSGLPSLQVGMLISIDDRNWYEIAKIIDAETVQVTRPYDGNNQFNNYKSVTVTNINIRAGIYQENINLQNVHFIRFKGVGHTRESVIIQPVEVNLNEAISLPNFYNVQDYGALYIEKLTARNITEGPIITTVNESNTLNLPVPRDTNLSLSNVHLDAACCDVIFSSYGHVLIKDSRLEGENDVLGGFFKSLTIQRSHIMSLLSLTTAPISGKPIFVKLLYNSLIEDSQILTRSPFGSAVVLYGTNGNTLTIRNSVVIADGGSGTSSVALNLSYGSDLPSMVFMDGSRLLARSKGTSADIQMSSTNSVTLKCTEYATVTGGGTPVILPCQ